MPNNIGLSLSSLEKILSEGVEDEKARKAIAKAIFKNNEEIAKNASKTNASAVIKGLGKLGHQT